MKHWIVAAAVAVVGTFVQTAGAQTARIREGQLHGIRQNGVDRFLGIPYAAAPVGAARWKAAAPVAKWLGVREATQFGALCQQALTGPFGPFTHEYVDTGRVSEDCLFLNVWTPAKKAARLLPVLFWIHGGAFLGGSGSVPIYDGSEFARQGVVVVSINYRLGVLGFLAHPELTQEAGASGNYALTDMIAALRWVHDNIAAFGGDPARVAIAGQSAGSSAVHMLIASPAAKGLFARAIAESGSGVAAPLATLAIAEETGRKFSAKLGAASLAELRAMKAEDLLKGTGGDPMRAEFRFGPIVDGKVLPKDPAALAAGEFNDTPILTGLNADEGSAGPGYGSSTVDAFTQRLGQRFGGNAQAAAGLYPVKDDASAGEASKQLARDSGRASLQLWAEGRVAKSRQPIFAYYFSHTVPGDKSAQYGAFHTGEVPYVFGTFATSPERGFTAQDRSLSQTMARYWNNFVATGDPNGAGLPRWPTFDATKPELLQLDVTVTQQPILGDDKLRLFRAVAAGGGRLSAMDLPAPAATPAKPLPTSVVMDDPCPPPQAQQLPPMSADMLKPGARRLAMPAPDSAEFQAYQRKRLEDLGRDYANLCRYKIDNARLANGVRVRVVFMGDSITEGWVRADPALFAPGTVGRGISGQTSPQMLVRFEQDVIALHPQAVHIMAGTNDVAGNTGPISPEDFKNNIRAMAELAHANQIKVLLASIPPAAHFPWQANLQPAVQIRQFNEWIRQYAAERKFTYVDYYAALATPEGGMKPDLSNDGVHPNLAGYQVMRPIAEQAISEAVVRSRK